MENVKLFTETKGAKPQPTNEYSCSCCNVKLEAKQEPQKQKMLLG